MAYSTSTRGRGNPRTRLSGTTHKQLLSFSTYVDKGSKQIFKKWGDICRETAKQAIIDGYSAAFVKAKQDVGRELEDVDSKDFIFGGYAPGGGVQQFVNRADTSKYQGKQLSKHNRNKKSSAAQRIWDSLGFNFLSTKGSYVNAIAGSSDRNDGNTQFSGVTAQSTPHSNPKTTENRKPSGGFNLAKTYEIGVRQFKYNFKSNNSGFKGVTPTPTYSFNADVGDVLLVKDARHPGFPGLGIVERFHDAFKNHLDEEVLDRLRLTGHTLDMNKSSGGVS